MYIGALIHSGNEPNFFWEGSILGAYVAGAQKDLILKKIFEKKRNLRINECQLISFKHLTNGTVWTRTLLMHQPELFHK